MTVERRLAKVEATLSPTMLVRRWLIEAQQFDSFEGYTRTLYANGPELLPLDRLVQQTRAHAEAEQRCRPHEAREQAVRRAIGLTVFLFKPVLRTIVLAEEALEREELVQVGLAAHLGLAVADDGGRGRPVSPSHIEWLATLRDAALGRAVELRVLDAARTRVEVQYFDGQPVLFPATIRRWSGQRERTTGLAALAVRLAELDGLSPPPADDPEAFEARVSQLVADHVEPARSEALDELGDGCRAATVARRWVESKLA